LKVNAPDGFKRKIELALWMPGKKPVASVKIPILDMQEKYKVWWLTWFSI
jgi:hypothetical protein